jgi:putative N6-adenine-specific DNA methylase
MPIKPPRRPVVSQATGRSSGDTRDRAPSSTRAPHGRDPQGRDSTRSESSPGARPGFRSAGSDVWRAGDERRPASPPGGAARGASWGVPPRPAPARSGPRPESRDFGQRPVLAADRPAALYLSCPSGVESLLAIEARRILGAAAQITESRGGIEVIAPTTASAAERQHTLRDYAMRLNLESRLAQRVLWRVASRVYRHEDDIYVMARGVNWSDWITPEHTLRVDVVSRRSHLQSLNFAGLRVKDAVCDDLRERTGERPSVDTRFPDLGLVLYLDDLDAILYVDTSGEALFKRGWREDTGEAPLKETLAACHARRRRLARPSRRRCLARPLLRCRHHPYRSRPDCLRHRTRPAAPLCLRAAAALRGPPGRLAAPAPGRSRPPAPAPAFPFTRATWPSA